MHPPPPTTRIACIGECMVELRERADGALHRGFGGDTLNTAIYLARLGAAVDYVTALGDDAWSDEMLAAWQNEGVGTAFVQRLPGQLPGLYVIRTDAAGERRFAYWRDSAAARRVFAGMQPDDLDGFGVLYVSGITLSLYETAGREALFAALYAARRRAAWVVFDTNYRPSGWPDPSVAQLLFRRTFALATHVLASMEDLRLLFGEAGEAELREHAHTAEIALKLDSPASRLLQPGADIHVAAVPVRSVVDTTAAGDSFAAAYLAARLRGATPERAARAGHDLAGVVVGHPGAVIPPGAMPRASSLLGCLP